MRAKPSANSRSSKPNRTNIKSGGGNPKGIIKKSKDSGKKSVPDLSVLRQPVDTSICGLRQAVKVFETGTPEILHLLTYDCDVVYECKICRNLFRSIANFISHKRVYCTLRYSRAQDLMRSSKEAEDYTVILGGNATEKLPTRMTARKDLTTIVESISGQTPASQFYSEAGQKITARNADRKSTTVHLEPMENTSYGVFQTVLKPDVQEHLMRHQVTELHNLLSQDAVVLGPDGRILQNGSADLLHEEAEVEGTDENGLVCSICNIKFANRKTLTKHKRMIHESVRTCYSCPCCKNYFANPWSVYRHLYKVHRKTNEQVRRLRSQIHKKDVRIEKPVVSSASNKKVASPSKKKAGSEEALRMHQNNKEWMDHFEDDWELQRCGGCGRKFERKAALISHSQICQKRIAACNRIEQNHQSTTPSNMMVLYRDHAQGTVSPMACSKKPVPKPSPEKKIGIQVRMNYCKNSSSCSTSAQVSGRQRSCSRSVLGDESDIEALSVDGKEPFFQPGPVKSSLETKDNSPLEHFFNNTNKCSSSEGVDKVNMYLNNTMNRIDKVHSYEISTSKRSTFLRSNINKSKSLEEKCLQLRSALESGVTDSLKSGEKDKDVENSLYFDGNIDNTSESNTSAISSLSSQLTPLIDKGYVCEVEQSIEIKNINISTMAENIPSTEADSTSMSNGNGVHVTYNSQSHTGNIKFSPSGEAACEEVSTSIESDEVPQVESNLHVESSCLNDDEISVDLKPVELLHESKNFIQESELENTISILTRNQLKAICKDDLVLSTDDKKDSLHVDIKTKLKDLDVETATKELIIKKLQKCIDRNKQNTCRICNKTFKTICKLYRHIPTHTQWKRYECLFNGCTFQTFTKVNCLHHVTSRHAKESSEQASFDSLVGLINPSKWNLRLLGTARALTPRAVVSKTNTAVHSREVTARKIIKTVSTKLSKKSLKSGISEKNKLKSKCGRPSEIRKNKLTRLLSKVSTKQKLLTDFKSFSKVSKINSKSVSQAQKIKKIKRSSQIETIVNSVSPKRIKSVPVQNGIVDKNLGKRPVKKQRRLSTSKLPDSPKVKVITVKKERDEEIIVNHIMQDSSETNVVKERGSRSSSRKSSVNSIDQQKGKVVTNSAVKLEDCNSSHNPPVGYDSQSSVNIQTPEIVDGSSSLEEEESQESDRPVDDSHLKKIFMEVIFGPPSSPVQTSGRPVRNKVRPKRDSDFILGTPKDIDRDNVDGKLTASKKSVRPAAEPKVTPDTSRKSK